MGSGLDLLHYLKKAFTYDPYGNLLTVRDAKKQTIFYTYDVMDRVSSMTDQLGRKEYYEYDLNGNLLKLTDRKGQITEIKYDYLNRPVEKKFADNSVMSYAYDAGSRLTTINDSSSGLITHGYDVIDRLIKETTPQGSISYTYDALGRRTSMTVAGQEPVNYTYDANSRLTDLKSGTLDFGFIYDELGRRISLSMPNEVTTNYSYNSASNLLEMVHFNPSQIIEKLTYQYDPNGNRTSMNRLNVPVKSPEPVSGITYNASNQMLTFDDENLAYDLNGNLIQKDATTYQWNARNQLVGLYNATMNASFKYDALGRRIEKTISGKTTQYLYDGLDIIQEIENGMVNANYIRTLNIDEPLARVKADGSIRYYQQDALGSIVALTDEEGIVKTQYVYNPFGNITVSGEASDNPIQFAGRENDGTGLLYERYRYYSFDLQRYISEDPIGLAGGDVNYYVRVGNNPVNRIDPLGLVDWGRVSLGAFSVAKGFTSLGVGGTAVVFTAVATRNPLLTTVVATEMTPVFWAGQFEIRHGVDMLREGLEDANSTWPQLEPAVCH